MSFALLKERLAEHDISPEDAELLRKMEDWYWRITSGQVYKIKVKVANDNEATLEQPFRPNRAQRRFLAHAHGRDIILKARQMGFSTLIEILALDYALFNEDRNVVVIAHTQPDAEELFRDKIKYAYDRLPAMMRMVMPLDKETQSQLIFAHNNSQIRVTTSARGGTVHFLHVSEMGKIAARFPEKAREITTGSLQAVPSDGFVFIESTAEGQAGVFYEMAKRAEAKHQQGKTLTPADYKFHFYAWWMDPSYRMDPQHVRISPKDHEYFDKIEGIMDVAIDLDQRAWYVNKRDEEFAAEPNLMWREYPSTPDECWQSGTEGKYLVHVLAKARRENRIGLFPHRPSLPVNGFWDIGASDDTVVWLHQTVNSMDHFINYREGAGEGFIAFIHWIESLDVTPGTMYLPHDAANQKLQVEDTRSLLSQLREVKPSWDWQIVPRVATIQHGIDLMRNDFATYCFNEETTKEGIAHLENYSREWNTRLQTWTNVPRHCEHSHACLVAGTKIATDSGDLNIEDVCVGNKVRLPNGLGWGRVTDAGLVRNASDLIHIDLSDGATITCTPEHKIFTTIGLLRADDIRYNDEVIRGDASWVKSGRAKHIGFRAAFTESSMGRGSGFNRSEASIYPKPAAGNDCSTAFCLGILPSALRRLMGIGITSRRKTGVVTTTGHLLASTPSRLSTAFDITANQGATIVAPPRVAAPATCTGMFGNITTVQSLKGTIFTTLMSAKTTILSTISSASQALTTCLTMPVWAIGSAVTRIKDSLLKLATSPENGMAAPRGRNGTPTMLRPRGKNGNYTRKPANTAVRNTKRRSHQGLNTAVTTVEAVRVITAASEPVYDLTIEHHHCYYANGLLVSNSDALRQKAQGYQPASKPLSPRRKSARSGLVV